MNILHVKSIEVGKISAQPHPTLCIQFLNRENNDKNNTHTCVSVVVSSDFCRFCLFYHRCYSVIRRRCQTIQPLLPSSSAHSPACGQNILFLRSQEFFFVGHTNIHSQISYLKIFVPALTNEPAFNQLQRTLASGYKTRYVV